MMLFLQNWYLSYLGTNFELTMNGLCELLNVLFLYHLVSEKLDEYLYRVKVLLSTISKGKIWLP